MEVLKKKRKKKNTSHADFTWASECLKEEEHAPCEGFYDTFITRMGNDALYLPSLKRKSILHIGVCL